MNNLNATNDVVPDELISYMNAAYLASERIKEYCDHIGILLSAIKRGVDVKIEDISTADKDGLITLYFAFAPGNEDAAKAFDPQIAFDFGWALRESLKDDAHEYAISVTFRPAAFAAVDVAALPGCIAEDLGFYPEVTADLDTAPWETPFFQHMQEAFNYLFQGTPQEWKPDFNSPEFGTLVSATYTTSTAGARACGDTFLHDNLKLVFMPTMEFRNA